MPEHPPRILVLDQRSAEVQYESLSSSVPGKGLAFSIAYGYRRCNDFDESDSPGQDCVAIQFGEEVAVGVLADGVSQSFYGDIAAREVTRFLLKTLWQRREQLPDVSEIQAELERLSAEVREQVEKQTVTAPPDSLLGQALARTRERGSQTVFSAFILHAQSRELALYQVGDIHSWVHDSYGSCKVFPTNPLGRWSSTGRSELHLSMTRYAEVVGVVLHSDGARPEWGARFSLPEISQEALREAFVSEATERAAVDDVSFVAVAIGEETAQPSSKSTCGSETETTKGTTATVSQRQRLAGFGLIFIGLMALLLSLAALFFSPKKPAQAAGLMPPEAVELQPGAFYGQYMPLLPKEFSGGISGENGEAVAQLTIYGLDFERAEIKEADRKKPTVFVTPPQAAKTLFIKVEGGGNPEFEHSLVLTLYDHAGRPIYSTPLSLKGYHKQQLTAEPTGYQQVTIRPR